MDYYIRALLADCSDVMTKKTFLFVPKEYIYRERTGR